MSGMAFICTVMLLGIGGSILIALLHSEPNTAVSEPDAFAILPVPEDTPSARAFLEHYASQIVWMDAAVLRCVILVCNPETQPLCEELARCHDCYTVMTFGELHDFLLERLANCGNS